MNNIMIRLAVAGWIGLALGAAVAAPPPPPPANGGGIKPPDQAPPGKIYFQDNVVIVGPGFVKPDSNGGTVFVELSKVNPDPVNPDSAKPSKTVVQVVREVTLVKSQIEAEAVAPPRGLLDPASLLAVLNEEDMALGGGVFADPAFLHEEVGTREPSASDRTDQASSGGAAVQVAPGTPAPARAKKGVPGSPVVPSYWQLPIR